MKIKTVKDLKEEWEEEVKSDSWFLAANELKQEAIKYIKELEKEIKGCSCHKSGCDVCWKCWGLRNKVAILELFFNIIEEDLE